MTSPDGGGPASAPRSEPEPPPSSTTLGLELPVIRALRPMAAFAVVAVIAGRALPKAVAGVGLGPIVKQIQIAGDIVSQVFAFTGMLLAILTVLAAARSRLPLLTRLGAITLGGFTILPTLWAIHNTVPDLSAALVGCGAAVVALLAVPAAIRAPFARGPGLVLGLVALGGLLRLGGVALAFQGSRQLAPAAGALATAGFLADALAVLGALGWMAVRSRRLTSPASVAVLAGALFCAMRALAGRIDGIRAIDVFFWRMAVLLTSRPDPSVPLALQLFVAFLAPLLAAWAVLSRNAMGPFGAVVALAVCAHGALEMPPSALMLLIAALGLALSAHDGRGLWATLGPGNPTLPREPRDE